MKANLSIKSSFPAGAGTIFIIQAFAIVTFTALYSTLMLYATSGLKLNDSLATGITAFYVAFNSGLSLLGGYMAGRFLSNRVLFLIAMIAQMIGCILLSFTTISTLYLGLTIILIGSSFVITCINCMLTQLFQPDDKRRESAFLWNYSAMNLGGFIGFFISGYCQLHTAYHLLFLLCSLGNLIALVIAVCRWKLLKDLNTSLAVMSSTDRFRAYLKGIVIIIILFFMLRLLLMYTQFSNSLIIVAGAGMMLVIASLAIQQSDKQARNKMWAYLILTLTAMVFWTLYLLAPMALTLFIERNVDRHYLGMIIAPQWIQNINPVIIILGGPSLSILFSKLRDRGFQITLPIQFSIALLLIGIAFSILPIGIYFSNAQGYANINWILVCYVLQSLGELFISPIGYAMVGQLAPAHLQGVLMGTWILVTGMAAAISEYFSKWALENSHSTEPLLTNSSFIHLFGLLGGIAIMTGILLLTLIPFILRLTQEKKRILKPELAEVLI